MQIRDPEIEYDEETESKTQKSAGKNVEEEGNADLSKGERVTRSLCHSIHRRGGLGCGAKMVRDEIWWVVNEDSSSLPSRGCEGKDGGGRDKVGG